MELKEVEEPHSTNEESSSADTQEIPVNNYRGRPGHQRCRIRFYEPCNYEQYQQHDRYRRAGSLGPRRY